MAKTPRSVVATPHEGQRSEEIKPYFYRFIAPWGQIPSFEQEMWRKVVRAQPVAMICRETLISNILSLDWQINPRDSEMRDELKSLADYYIKLFEDADGLEFSNHIELICQDLLDLPFGGASEVGRVGDSPEGKVVWIQPLDGATLFPTPNRDFPVGQRLAQDPMTVVYFPDHAIDRMYMSPRTEIMRKGWGMPPPEKIYLALEMIRRGDLYYANLLLDTPEAGILDLGDMSKSSAEEWVAAFRTLLTGIDPYKVPVLYEHEGDVKFIPFTKPPADIMYDTTTMKYAALVCAGYGLTLGDIGFSQSTSGGDTLAGTIRQERRAKRNGLAVVKRKLVAYFNRMLPSSLEFKWIDADDELNLSVARSRLANATAFKTFEDGKVLTPNEIRSQLIADGLITIPIPEKIDGGDEFPAPPAKLGGGLRNPDTGDQIKDNKVPVSTGGHGDVKVNDAQLVDMSAYQSMDSVFKAAFEKILRKQLKARLTRLAKVALPRLAEQATQVAKSMTDTEVDIWKSWYDEVVAEEVTAPEIVMKTISDLKDLLRKELSKDLWWKSQVSPDTIEAIFALMYEKSLERITREMSQFLFTEGYLSTPNLSKVFSVARNTVLRAELRKQAQESLNNIDEGSQTYIVNAVISQSKEWLSRPDIREKLKNGEDIKSIISDPVFMDGLTAAILSSLTVTFMDRINVITDFELGRIGNAAMSQEFSAVNLQKKAWVCHGQNPCEICLDNQAQGFVPLSFVYNSTMGETPEPPGHPRNCQCNLEYDPDELATSYLEGNFNPWYGD